MGTLNKKNTSSALSSASPNNQPTGLVKEKVTKKYELLIDRGEIGINSLGEGLRNIVDSNMSIRCEVGEEKEIDGVMYVGVTNTSEVMGVKGFTILNNLKKAEGVKGIQGRQKSGYNINLIPVEFVRELQAEYACNPGEEKEIDRVMYVGVIQECEVMGVKGFTILRNLKKKEGIKSIQGRQKNGSSVALVPVEFVRELNNTCEPREEKEINGVIYVGVTNTNEVMGVKGQTILNNLKKAEGVKSIQGRQRNGKNITLVPVEFVKELQAEYTCNPGEEVEIDGVIYAGVTSNNEVMGIKGPAILYRLKKTGGIKTLQGKQKNGQNVTLVPIEFINGLKEK